MKISKLRYVFAFVLMVAVSMVTTNVKAATMPNKEQIKISTIIASQLAAIEDGDEPSASAYENEVYLFTTGFRTNDSVLGAAKNPVYSYSIKNNAGGVYWNAYSVNYNATASNNREEVVGVGVGNGSAVDNRIGLALAFSNATLGSAQAADQTAITDYLKSASYATQMYIWMANAGVLGTADENAIVNANLSGNALSEYYYIRNSVNQALSNPSYTYASQTEANANPVEMTWNEATGRYEVTLNDVNAIDVVAGINLTVDGHSGIEYSKNGSQITFFATEQVGTSAAPICIPVYKSVNRGFYVPQYVQTSSGEKLVYLANRQNVDTVTYVSFYTNALRVKVTKSLGTSATNSRTGDATVAGAVYGIYEDQNCTKLVQEVTTDASGVAVSDPLELKDYYVKELTAPAGCKIDTQVKTALASAAKTEANGQKVTTVTSTDNVIYGGFRMIVSVSDLSGSTTKDPAVGSKLKLTLDSDPNQSYETVVDDKGYADFTDIPYGQYTCTEIEKVKPELDYMDPMPILINSEDTYIYSKLVNTEVAQRYIKIEKQDAETGKLIPAANTEFRVVDSNNQTVVQKVMYPYEETLYTYKTDAQGFLVMPEMLPYGEYKIYEIVAPEGYYNQSATENVVAGTFKVETNEVGDYEKDMVVAVVKNMPQKVNLTVKTTGQILTGTTSEADGKLTINRPVFGGSVISGVVYKVTAKEDIKTLDGTVRMAAGETLTLTTDANGQATAKLYLGSYTIEQVTAPEGYVLNTEKQDLLLTYKGQNILEYAVNKAYTLDKQAYEVELTKEFKDLSFYRENEDDVMGLAREDAYLDVVVGIYAAEDIKNAKGEVKIPADTLVDVVRMDMNGKATLNSELPTGKFYAKELETNENYVVSDKKYEINAVPANTTDKVFDIAVETIVNQAKKVTTFTLTKIEEVSLPEIERHSLLSKIEDFAEGVLGGLLGDVEKTTPVTRLAGAEYEVLYMGNSGKFFPLLEKVDGEKVPVVRTTDENGEITLEGLPYGTYAVRETVAPKYYDLDEKAYQFEVTTVAQEAELVLQDVRTKVDLTVEVIDEDKVVVEDATVLLIDPETNEVAYEAATDEEGTVVFEGIRAGRYVRVVEDLADQYVLPEDTELYLENEPVEDVVEVVYKKGTIVVYKTDAETAEPVPGCKFAITDELGNLVEEGMSDENGYFKAEDLRYGVYYVEETEAAEGYELDATVFEVTIDEDGAVYEVDFTNVPTGDIAVAAYVMVALVSLGLIVRTAKKMKRN
ncbi:MAG: hypothetical protein J6A15_06275 [Clostridia bacterium]|nr:hypothetical protein [Clostridia bacterium]